MRKLLPAFLSLCALLPGCRGHKHQTTWQQPEGFDTSGRNFTAKMRSVVYPYSVVAGGVESREDIDESIRRDPIVAEHYAGIDKNRMEVVNLRNDTSAYVSFRKNGAIYWTSKKVHVPQGERVLSDGTNCIRARCGNRISWKPRGPVLQNESEEPSSAQFNTPELRGQSLDEAPIPPVIAPELANWVVPNPITAAFAGAVGGTAGPRPMPAPGAGAAGGAGGGGGAGSTGEVAPLQATGDGWPTGERLLGVLISPVQPAGPLAVTSAATALTTPPYVRETLITASAGSVQPITATLIPGTPIPSISIGQPVTVPVISTLLPQQPPSALTPPVTTNPPGPGSDTPTVPGTPTLFDHPDSPGTRETERASEVPEPSTIVLLIVGGALIKVVLSDKTDGGMCRKTG